MVVYVEYVLIDNFVIDFLLLKLTLQITGKKVKKIRLVLISLFGMTASLTYPLISEFPLISIATKILLGVLMALFIDKNGTLKSFATTFGVFTGLTFLTGGAIIGIFNVFRIDYSSEVCIAVMAVPVYALIKPFFGLINRLYRRKDVSGFLFRTVITVNGINVEGRGFLDSGNGTYDGNFPVIFLSKKIKARLINEKTFKAIKKITVSTMNGYAEKTAVKTDSVAVYVKDKPNIYYNVTACFTDEPDFRGCEFLLHPSVCCFENAETTEVNKKYTLKDA